MNLDLDALFKISYGLFVAGVEQDGVYNGCIINTASQVTAEPPRLIVTMQKNTYTSELIQKKGSLSLSILSQECTMETIKRFGYRSGREAPKFEGIAYETDESGNPYLGEGVNAVVRLQVAQTVDVDTHLLFICPVLGAESRSEAASLTYDDYRILKSGGTLSAGERPKVEKKWTCAVCHYVYDGEIPFEELPDDYVCPICGVGKENFILA